MLLITFERRFKIEICENVWKSNVNLGRYVGAKCGEETNDSEPRLSSRHFTSHHHITFYCTHHWMVFKSDVIGSDAWLGWSSWFTQLCPPRCCCCSTTTSAWLRGSRFQSSRSIDSNSPSTLAARWHNIHDNLLNNQQNSKWRNVVNRFGDSKNDFGNLKMLNLKRILENQMWKCNIIL